MKISAGGNNFCGRNNLATIIDEKIFPRNHNFDRIAKFTACENFALYNMCNYRLISTWSKLLLVTIIIRYGELLHSYGARQDLEK